MRAEAGWCKTILLNTFCKSDRAALLSHKAAVRTYYSGVKSMSPNPRAYPQPQKRIFTDVSVLSKGHAGVY